MSNPVEGSKARKCEVCMSNDAKYMCPQCEVRTCSLPCVNIHKKELSCDGIRSKVSFKPISKMNNLDLLSDYRLLEEVTRSVENYARDKAKSFTRCNKELPIHLYKLRSAAYKRKIHLVFLPQNFSRHQENTTYLDWKKQIISWRVEWIFPQAENMKCADKRISEDELLGTQLDKYLDPQLCDKSIQTRLQWYQAAGIRGVKLLLKAEHVPKAVSRFFELDPRLSLKANLQGRAIVEFPLVHVILKGHEDSYDILDADEHIKEDEATDFLAKRTKIERNSPERHEKSDNKNFPFNPSEHSDEESY